MLIDKIKAVKGDKNAIILAHNYQLPVQSLPSNLLSLGERMRVQKD